MPDLAIVHLSECLGEVTPIGYERRALGGKTVESDVDGNAVRMADQVQYTGLVGLQTAMWAVVYEQRTGDGDSPVVDVLEITGGVLLNGTVTIKWGGAHPGPVSRVREAA